MKKIIAGVLAVSALLSASNMALAAGSGVNIDDIYYGTTNTVKTATNGYTTVIIKKIAELDKTPITATDNSNVVYVNQNSSGFDDAVGFLMKNGTSDGYYEATFGNANGTSKSVNFVVGGAAGSPEDAIADAVVDPILYISGDQPVYRKNFAKLISADGFSEYKSVKLVSADGSECLGAINIEYGGGTQGNYWENKTNTTGGGDIVVALQVYGIPEKSKDLRVYFSKDTVNANN